MIFWRPPLWKNRKSVHFFLLIEQSMTIVKMQNVLHLLQLFAFFIPFALFPSFLPFFSFPSLLSLNSCFLIVVKSPPPQAARGRVVTARIHIYPFLFQKDVVACIVEVDVCLPDGGGVPTQGSPAGAGLLLQPSLRGEPSTWLSSERGKGRE